VRRIVRSEALCLRVRDFHESSKLVTFFTPEQGKVACLAKGARRLKSRFGAALDLFAQSRIIYYWRETRDLYTLSDAELTRSFSGLVQPPERFLAAEQMTEFVLRVIPVHDPNPQLHQLLLNYLSTLETASPGHCSALVCSFLLKAASFLGFRPELRRCVVCRRPPPESQIQNREPKIQNPKPNSGTSGACYFDPARGGIICSACAAEHPPFPTPKSQIQNGKPKTQTLLDPAALDALCYLLYTPAAQIAADPNLPLTSQAPPLSLLSSFLYHHFDPLLLNSLRWQQGLKPSP